MLCFSRRSRQVREEREHIRRSLRFSPNNPRLRSTTRPGVLSVEILRRVFRATFPSFATRFCQSYKSTPCLRLVATTNHTSGHVFERLPARWTVFADIDQRDSLSIGSSASDAGSLTADLSRAFHRAYGHDQEHGAVGRCAETNLTIVTEVTVDNCLSKYRQWRNLHRRRHSIGPLKRLVRCGPADVRRACWHRDHLVCVEIAVLLGRRTTWSFASVCRTLPTLSALFCGFMAGATPTAAQPCFRTLPVANLAQVQAAVERRASWASPCPASIACCA